MSTVKREEKANHSENRETNRPEKRRNQEKQATKDNPTSAETERKSLHHQKTDRAAISKQRTKKFENSGESSVTGKVAGSKKIGVLVTDGDRNGRPSQPTRQHKPKATDELKI